ncbi:LysR family transcriptional regulator [Mangrovicella endophytica]|uniref:LysR family transcriptional regulator n=1 Tax=Mangrovicella endophytica TaxID=2066697 RepID=UPI000C9DCC0C|nr:LysR family transcriptional regulator [Mangrovicella endophytica]
MTLEQLRIFVAVAQDEHMTRAARSLNLTQSAVSAGIAALEARHDVRLFHRVGRGIQLTEAGRIFLDEARGVLARAATAEQALAEIGGLSRGRLRVVASQTVAGYWLPRHLAAFRLRHPLISVDLAIGNTGEVARAVHDGEAELGFCEGVVDDPALAHWPVDEDRMLLVGDHAAPGPIDVAWLRGAAWVQREPGSGTRSTLEAALQALGVDATALQTSLVLPSNEAVRAAVEAGAGVAALSESVVAASIATGALHRLPFELPPRPFYGLRHKERYRSRAADALLVLIEDALTEGRHTAEPETEELSLQG